MPILHPAVIAHERKRWMRPDAYRFVRPDWRRFVKPGSELWTLCESIERKYSPDQPRVPAGSSDGGQWTGDGGSGVGDRQRPGMSTDVRSILDKAKQLAASGRSKSYLRCLDLCSPILEEFQPPGSDINKWEFHRCMAACLGNR
jgi:hypothetical protein